MKQFNDARYKRILLKFETMTRTEIISRLKWIKDRNLTYRASHEAIMLSAAATGLPYGKIAEKMAENHGFSNWITLKCLLLMKSKFDIKVDEIPPYPNKNWKEVATGIVKRKKAPEAPAAG